MTDPVLEVAHVSKTYSGVPALIDFDLSIRPGEVHCLLGENGCGKSTFMKTVAGVVTPDRAPPPRLVISGRPYHRITPADALREGIQVIYQDLALFPNLSVAENISMNERMERGRRLVFRREMCAIARSAMAHIGVDLDPDERIENYPIARQQMVAICRALTSGARLIIMDEPTASLGQREVEHLFSVIGRLKSRGIAVLFVGHKLHEVFAIADRITVMRDGRRIKTFESAAETSQGEVIELMTGRSVASKPYVHRGEGAPLLEVRHLCKAGQYQDVSLTLFAGDVLAVLGLVGAGRTELATSLFGLNPPDSGEVRLGGRAVRIRSAQQAIDLGLGYVPESRLTQGLFADKAVGDNIVISIIERLRGVGPLLDLRLVQETVRAWIGELSIKTRSADVPVKQLSGGNQQRVVLSRWLATRPKVLILDEPTVGIDIGAKAEIHAHMRSLASSGMGILMITDEIEEALDNANRIIVMNAGRVVGELESGDADASRLQQLLAGEAA